VLTFFANRNLVPIVGEHARVFAVCEQEGAWTEGGSSARKIAIDTLIQ